MGITLVVCIVLLAGACAFGIYVGKVRARYVTRILMLRAEERDMEARVADLTRDEVLRQARVETLAGEVEELERKREEERQAALAAEVPKRTVLDVLQAGGKVSAEDVLRARTYLAGGKGEQTEEQALIILGVITDADVEAAARELE